MMYIVFPAPVTISATTIKDNTKMGLKQIDHGTKEYRQMIALRQAILRDPLGLKFSPEELEKEKENILIAAFEEEDDMLGCCMLTKIDNQTLQLRQMAVKNNLQGKGIGASIISFAETISRDRGYRRIIMHARDTAIGFYEKFGYKVKGDAFTEINLPHHIMEKKI